MKKYLALFVILAAVLVLCLASAAAGSVWDEAFTGENVRLERVSLVPEDFSGFTVREAGFVSVSLSEDNAAVLFRNAMPLSLGPDGAVLWLEDTLGEDPSLFVQRDREILRMSAEDPSITEYLRDCFIQTYGRKYGLRKPAEWSADGRYISLLARGSLFETPPFLLDTGTGEIIPVFPEEGPADFLAENGLKSCRADYGLMSADGRSLYLVMVLFGDEVKDENGVAVQASPAIVRYDMETGALSLVCRLEYMPGSDFSEIDARHLLVGSGTQTLLITLDDSGAASDISPWGIYSEARLHGLSGLSGPALANIQILSNRITAFSVLREEPLFANDWYLLPKDAAPAGPWILVTGEKMYDLLSEPIQSTDPDETPAPREIDHYSIIYKTIPIADTPYLLLMIPGAANPVELWPDYWYTLPAADFVLLNTETMETRVLPTDSVWTYTALSNAAYVATDPVVRGDALLLGNSVFRLNPNADSSAGAGSEADPELIRLDSAELTEELEGVAYAGNHLSMGGYEYALRGITINGYYVSAEIAVLPDSYQITVIFDRILAPIVPEVLTVERYEEIKGMLSKKEQKRLSSVYKRVKSETLDQQPDKDELLQAYPALKDQDLFILKSDVQQHQLEKIESVLRDAGYTEADYEADMAFAPGAADNQTAASSNGIRYLFRCDGNIAGHPGPVAGLLFLTDYLSGTLYTQYMTADPRPDSADSLPVTGTIEFEYIPYEVTLDSVTEEDPSTMFTFTAIPAGSLGWLQK